MPNAKKVAVMAPNDETGQEAVVLVEKAYQANGIEVTGKYMFERDTPDFTPILTKVLSTQPDIIETDGSAPVDVGLIVKQARQLNFKGLINKIGGAGTAEVIRVAGPEYSDGFMYQTSADLSDPKVKRLMAAFAAKYKDPFNATLITGYDMSVMLFDAIVKVQSLDARKIAPVLADMKGNGTFGPLEFGGQAYYGIKRQPLFSFFSDGSKKE